MSRSFSEVVTEVFATHEFDCANCDAKPACGPSPMSCQYRGLLPKASVEQLQIVNVYRLLDCKPLLDITRLAAKERVEPYPQRRIEGKLSGLANIVP